VVTVLLAVLAVGAVGIAGWSGYQWWRAVNGNEAQTLQARDTALRVAREVAVTLATSDSAHPEDSLHSWQAVATGPLLDKLRQDSSRYLDDMKRAANTTNARVVDAALTEVDADAGTATAIAALDVTQTPLAPNGRPTMQKPRMKLTLDRTDAGWKVASSGYVNA
jgi:Mce-associated membrane protein